VTVKVGLDVRQQIRDNRAHNPTLTFVGPDGRAGTADDNARQILDADYARKTAPFGFPPVEWTSNFRLFDIWEANPGYFTENLATTHTADVNQSNRAEEIISAAYIRGDLKFLDGKLKLVGGIRAEQTNVKAEGRLVDPTLNFRRDANGRVILGANGAPQTIATNALEIARLTNIDRGLRADKEYLRWFPSVNGTYQVSDNIVARAGYYWSVGRPNFTQYAGGVNLPNTENPPGPNNRISVNNAGIKAWTAQTVKVALEYYFEPVGLLSVSGFSRSFKNMFGSTIRAATPDFLGLYSLSPVLYGDYDVSTQYNIPGTVRTSGVSVNYKQALNFLPGWARGVRVFANGSAQRVTGDDSGSFSGYTPRVANWGISLSRPKYTARLNWNYTGVKRQGPVATGRSIAPGTFNWDSKRLVLDLNAEYTLWQRISVFASLNNILNEPVDNKIFGPDTPEYARFRQRQNYGSLWTFGVKGVW
jgi:TonB-dependent receptor